MALKTRRMIVFRAREADAEKWEPVLPADVPSILTQPSMMGALVDGEMAEMSDGYFYRAEPQPIG